MACQEQPCNIKIADFGLAKLLTDDCGSLSTPCGTVGYAAPEITTADSYKSSVDLWSLGIILYTLLSGTPPFLTDDESTLADMVVRYRAIPELLLAAAALLLRRCFDAPFSQVLSLSLSRVCRLQWNVYIHECLMAPRFPARFVSTSLPTSPSLAKTQRLGSSSCAYSQGSSELSVAG